MKKRYWVPMVLVLSLPLGIYLAIKLPVFGGHPSAEDKKRFAGSIAFNAEKGVFQNRRPGLIEQMRAESLSLDLLKEWFSYREAARPTEKLPEMSVDVPDFVIPDKNTKLIWLGHSSFLLNIAGTIVLVDPVFSNSAAPVNFAAKRFQETVLALEDLPQIDIVLISHDHYDHLDHKTIRFFANSETLFISPLGVGTHLARWGISPQRIIEKDWWESHVTHKIEFTAAPAQHFSGRDGINNDETLWASWIISSAQSNLYYSGDSGYDTHYKAIGERFGPFDLSIMENGQYDKAWPSVHLFPQETLQAHMELDADYLMPVHWGMFELAFHTWYESVETLTQLADKQNIDLVTPMLGQVVTLDGFVETERWWTDVR